MFKKLTTNCTKPHCLDNEVYSSMHYKFIKFISLIAILNPLFPATAALDCCSRKDFLLEKERNYSQINKFTYSYARFPEINPRILYLGEGGVTLLKANSFHDYVLLGPLQPCLGITIHHAKSQTTLAVHLGCAFKIKSIKKYLKLIQFDEARELTVNIYTNSMNSQSNYENLFQDICNGYSQYEILSIIKMDIAKLIGVDPKNIITRIHTMDSSIDEYEISPLFLLLDKKGNIYHYCPHKEDFFQLRNNMLEFDDEQGVLYDRLPRNAQYGIIKFLFEKKQKEDFYKYSSYLDFRHNNEDSYSIYELYYTES